MENVLGAAKVRGGRTERKIEVQNRRRDQKTALWNLLLNYFNYPLQTDKIRLNLMLMSVSSVTIKNCQMSIKVAQK